MQVVQVYGDQYSSKRNLSTDKPNSLYASTKKVMNYQLMFTVIYII